MIIGATAAQAAALMGGTVPYVPPTFADVKFLCAFDGTNNATAATDLSSAAHTISFLGNAKLSTTSPKFGTACLLTDGTGDIVYVASHADFLVGADPFTAEGWWRFASTSQIVNLIGVGHSPTLQLSWGLQFNSGDLIATYSTDGNINNAPVWVASGIVINTYYHIALERSPTGKYRIYLNGSVLGVADVPDAFFASSARFSISGNHDASTSLNGRTDEVRFTRGAWYNGVAFSPTTTFPRS